MSLRIIKVESKKELQEFINFPHDLYKDDPYYVPELQLAMKEHLNKKKNPYFLHSDAELYLAKSGEKVVGRIAATINNNYNKFHNSNIGWFGFYDTIDDHNVSSLLLETVETYCKKANADRILGPANFNTNDTAGLLVDGYEEPPVVMMTYNKPYYLEHLEKYGYLKEMDMFAYYIPTATVSEKSLRLKGLITKKLLNKGVTFRNINMKRFSEEVETLKVIYRQAWENNWGFVPPTDAEFEELAKGLKLAIHPDYVIIAEQEGKAVGFAVGIPDLNEITIRFKKGKLLPFNIFKLLLNKKKPKTIRVILLGVLESHRKMGIEAVFFAEMISKAKEQNRKGGEASWILESNKMMIQAAENMNGKPYKRYRILAKTLN